MPHADKTQPANATPQRRSFLIRFAASVFGAIIVLFPFVAGSGVLLSPLRRRRKTADGDAVNATQQEGFVRICPLDALSADGVPRPYAVTMDVVDAWTRSRGQRVGSVFLTRSEAEAGPQVTAFTAACPHLGCAVEFDADNDRYECPCHESGFAKDGVKMFGPSLRGLDPLEVKLVDNDGTSEVWVAFQYFRAGVAERIPVA